MNSSTTPSTFPLPHAAVFVVDDDVSVRRSLVRLLRSAGYQAEAFPSAMEFLASGRCQQGPACLVLDLCMPGLTGLELQQRLRALKSSLAVVFVTGRGDIPSGVRAMREGAVDFLSKPFDDAQLLEAVAAAIAKSVRDEHARAKFQSAQTRFDTLTPREREVMSLISRGMMNKQAAERLGVAVRTIKLHRARVMEKMQVVSVAHLVPLAKRLGL
jgi:FixJ family two-component response regulator